MQDDLYSLSQLHNHLAVQAMPAGKAGLYLSKDMVNTLMISVAAIIAGVVYSLINSNWIAFKLWIKALEI